MHIERTICGIGLTILFLVVNATFSVISLTELGDHERNVVRTHKILLKLERTMAHLKAAESSHHGFLVVNDPRQLEPFREAAAGIVGTLHELRVETSDNPRHQERLAALRGLTDVRLQEMHAAIRERVNGFEAIQHFAHSLRGHEAIQKSRALIDEIRTEEEGRLVQRSARASASRLGAMVSIGLSTLAGLGLVLLAWRLIREESRVRTETEQILRESAERMRKLALVASRTDNSVVITDARRRIEWVNDGFTRLTGYSSQEVLGKTPAELLQGPLTDPQAIALMRSGLQKGEGFQIELLNYTKDGRVFWNLVDVQPVLDEAGQAVNYIAVQRDISERKKFEQEIRAKSAELEAANTELSRLCAEAEAASRAKSEFVANMSHEIRTPMNAILGYSELLLDPSTSEDRRRECALAVRRNGKHLLQLINDILDLSRIEAGKLKVEIASVAPARILFDLAAMMRPRAVERGLSFELQFDGPVPESISTDPNRFRQILINLAGNAIRFTDRGGVRIVCRFPTHLTASDARLEVDVVDTGIGISSEQLGGLFQPFAQADGSATRRFGGTGLGLYISRRLAEALGGSIRVESTPGKGSCFTVSLPVGELQEVRLVSDPQDESTALADEVDRLSPLPGEYALSNRRILVADDGRDNQYLISLFLTSAGAQVDVVEHGQAAIDRIRNAAREDRPYDVVLMDMQMPELDGYAATARLRKDGFAGPIVALTAHAMAGDREKCLAAGCSDYLSKPVTRNNLLRTVAAHLAEEGTLEVPESRADADGPEAVTRFEPIVSRFADDPRMAEAIGRFVTRLSERVGALLDAVQQGDRERLIREAHQIKGAAGGYGFDSLTDAARALEARLRDVDAAELALDDIEELVDLCRRATAPTAAHVHS